MYAKYVGCGNVNALDTTKIEIAAQQYLTSLLFLGLNKQSFAQLKHNVNKRYVLGQDLMYQSFQEVMQLTTEFRSLPTTSGGGGGGPNNTGVAFAQTAQTGGTNNVNHPGGTKPQGENKGLGKKKNPKGVSGCFFCKQKGINDANHLVSDCQLATSPEKSDIPEKMRRGINRQVQAKEEAEKEEKGTSNVNVAAGLTEDEVRPLIFDTIKEM